MASLHTARLLRPRILPTKSESILPFLVPAIQCSQTGPIAHFSTSPARCKKDNNSSRGLSAVRRTGLRKRQTLSVKQKDFENQQLPRPVPIEHKPAGTPDHGLWDFFKDQKLVQTPLDESKHGRAWTIGELRSRDWNALHQLWWVCVKERNRLATEKIERNRIDMGYGDYENKERDETIQKTMKAIADTLAERHQAYEEAYQLALKDPTIDLSRRDGPQFTPPEANPYEVEPEDEFPQSAAPNKR